MASGLGGVESSRTAVFGRKRDAITTRWLRNELHRDCEHNRRGHQGPIGRNSSCPTTGGRAVPRRPWAVVLATAIVVIGLWMRVVEHGFLPGPADLRTR